MRDFKSKTLVACGVCGTLLLSVLLLRHAMAFDAKKCIYGSNNVCATCDTTIYTYQCSPQEMPPGFNYGSCINLQGKCADENAFNCGDYTYNCMTPKKVIEGDNTCKFHNPKICKAE